MAGTLTAEDFYRLWFPERRPGELTAAVEAVGQFYNLGRTPEPEAHGPIPYSFARDAGAIFAAFRRHYGIDLHTASLHWWHFRALLEGLFTHSFRQRVGYRLCDLQGMEAQERAEVLKYRSLYAIEPEAEDLSAHLSRLRALAQQERK